MELYERVLVVTVMYEAETLEFERAGPTRVIVLMELMFLRSMSGVTRMD